MRKGERRAKSPRENARERAGRQMRNNDGKQGTGERKLLTRGKQKKWRRTAERTGKAGDDPERTGKKHNERVRQAPWQAAGAMRKRITGTT